MSPYRDTDDEAEGEVPETRPLLSVPEIRVTRHATEDVLEMKDSDDLILTRSAPTPECNQVDGYIDTPSPCLIMDSSQNSTLLEFSPQVQQLTNIAKNSRSSPVLQNEPHEDDPTPTARNSAIASGRLGRGPMRRCS